MKTANNPWYYKINGNLIKKKKPCLNGDYVHIKNFTGCYRVHSVNLDHFTVMRKHNIVNITWDNFVCLKGNGTSEETLLRKRLVNLSDTININITKQVLINSIIADEIKNLRKTF